jgi:NAD-dependent SIR2 family protein deacetylase
MSKQPTDSERLGAFLAAHPRITVLTGAGISRAAGIPTYRDEAGNWRHSEPVTHREFLTHHSRRQRYWARSMRGWPAVDEARPTAAHRALATLEHLGHIDTLITQNVDRLHQRAGSRRVIDLHGRLDRVRCLACHRKYDRGELQRRLRQANGTVRDSAPMRPDGDAEFPAHLEVQLSVPDCNACGGTLMPDVVFFGANVPRQRVEACLQAIERSDALLAVGSSLQVFSGFRFCRHASRTGKPLAVLNPGATRADGLAQLKLEGDCQVLLPVAAGL